MYKDCVIYIHHFFQVIARDIKKSSKNMVIKKLTDVCKSYLSPTFLFFLSEFKRQSQVEASRQTCLPKTFRGTWRVREGVELQF